MPDDRRHTLANECGEEKKPFRHTNLWSDDGDPDIVFYVDLEGKYRFRRIGEKPPSQPSTPMHRGRE